MAPQRKIPVINLSGIDTAEGKERITKELVSAAEDIGFFSIINHGISKQDIDRMFQLEAQFFNLPDEVKAKSPFDPDKYLGWSSPKRQTAASTGLPDIVESMGCGWGKRMDGLWPSEEDCPGYKAGKQAFATQCHALLLRMLACLARGLSLPEKFFEEALDPTAEDNQCIMRCNHSPSMEGMEYPPNSFRTAPHTDFSTLTLLFLPDQGGLEVVPGREAATQYAMGDDWTPVPVIEGAIVCNVGDQLMWWSDDRFKSNYHRVKLPGPDEYRGERYSIAYFSNPRKSTVIQGPLKKYPAMTGAQVLEARGNAYKAAMAARHLGSEAAREAMQAAIAHIVSDARISTDTAVCAQ